MPEVTYGTPVMPATSGSFSALEIELTPAQERLQRDDTTGIRSFQNNRFSGRKSADWRVRGYITPSGVAGTAPDMADFYQAAMGDATAGLTSTVQYTPDDDDLPSLSIWKHAAHFVQGVYGAACNQMVLNMSGSDFSTVEFSGPGKSFVQGGTTTLSATANKDVTNIKIADADFFSQDILIQVGDSTATTGYKILSISSNGTIHITPALRTTVASGVTVTAFAPTVTTVGDSLHGITGSFTTNAVAVTIISASVTLNNNLQLRDDEYGQSTPTAIILDRRREVSLTLELYLTRANFYIFGEAARFLAQDITMLAGDTAAKRLRVLMDQGELDVPAITDPGAEGEVTLSASGRALSTSAGQNDITVELF